PPAAASPLPAPLPYTTLFRSWWHIGNRGPLRLRSAAGGDGHSSVCRRQPPSAGTLFRRTTLAGGWRERRALRGLGAECPPGLRGGQLQQLGWPPPSHAAAHGCRSLGNFHSPAGCRRSLQIRDSGTRWAAAPEGRPPGTDDRTSAGHGLRGGAAPGIRLAGRAVGEPAPGTPGQGSAAVHLRGTCRLLAPYRQRRAPGLDPVGRAADSLCAGHGLHPYRAAAGDGAPLRRLLGLSAPVAVRPQCPLRDAGAVRRLR